MLVDCCLVGQGYYVLCLFWVVYLFVEYCVVVIDGFEIYFLWEFYVQFVGYYLVGDQYYWCMVVVVFEYVVDEVQVIGIIGVGVGG